MPLLLGPFFWEMDTGLGCTASWGDLRETVWYLESSSHIYWSLDLSSPCIPVSKALQLSTWLSLRPVGHLQAQLHPKLRLHGPFHWREFTWFSSHSNKSILDWFTFLHGLKSETHVSEKHDLCIQGSLGSNCLGCSPTPWLEYSHDSVILHFLSVEWEQ